MANIKVKVDYPISDGTKLKFRTPCESTSVEGLVVTAPIENGVGYAAKTFTFVDSHGKELSGLGNVFASDVLIAVLLDVTKGRAYIKNADNNSYIEDIKVTVQKMEEERREIFDKAGKYIQQAKDAADGVVTIEQNSKDELRFWVGTKEEYDKQKDTLPKNTFCIISNDTSEEELIALIKSKAPSGFGLGEVNSTWIGDANLATKNGWYKCKRGFGINLPPLDGEFVLLVRAYDENLITQTAYAANGGGGIVRRTFVSGVWQEWEWENPPMNGNTEYRTTERYMNEPVYTKLFDVGNLPNNSSKDLHHHIYYDENGTKLRYGYIVRCSGQARRDDISNGGFYASAIPSFRFSWIDDVKTDHHVGVRVSDYAIVVSTNYDASADYGFVQVWYTKKDLPKG